MWKDVVGFEGIYQVSDDGQVKALERDIDYGNRMCHRKERLLRQHFNSDGYYMVKLLDCKNHNVHRLVAEAFLGVYPELEVDHVDTVRTNNHVSNLRWVTHHENILHTYEVGHGAMSNKYMESNNNAKQIIVKTKDMERAFPCIRRCALWIQQHYLPNTKIGSIYDSIRKHNINKTPYCGLIISYHVNERAKQSNAK
jgi:hypothetical protein